MSDESQQIGQDEIEQLLKKAQAANTEPSGGEAAAKGGSPDAQSVSQDEVDALLKNPARPAPKPASDAPAAEAPKTLSQHDVEALMAKGAKPPQSPRPARTVTAHESGTESLAPADVEYLLQQAESALASIDHPREQDAEVNVLPFEFADFTGAPASSDAATIDLVRDVELDLRIELGRTHMYLEDLLKLRKGSVVPLEKLAGDPVDVYVNGRLVARGEVLVLNDNFCVRVAELVAGENAGAA